MFRVGYRFRQAKIKNFGVSFRSDPDVGRFHIAVNHSEVMSRLQGAANLFSYGENPFHRQGSRSEKLFQIKAGHPFHGNEKGFILCIDFVDRGDVGMRDGGGYLSFPQKTRSRHFVLKQLARKHLECHRAFQAHVLGLEDHPHAAGADKFEDLKMPEPSPGAQFGGPWIYRHFVAFAKKHKRTESKQFA